MWGSLKFRFALASALMVVVFSGLLFTALDRRHRRQVLHSEQDRVQGWVYTVLAGTDVYSKSEIDINLSAITQDLPEGLSLWLLGPNLEVKWQAQETKKPPIDLLPQPFTFAAGDWHFPRHSDAAGRAWFVAAFCVTWLIEDAKNPEVPFVVMVEAPAGAYPQVLWQYRRELALWLGLGSLALLALQFFILQWGLWPLRRLQSEVDAVRLGQKKRVTCPAPQEFSNLVASLNHLVLAQEQQKSWLKNTSADLAHALKTPLAGLRLLLERSKASKVLKTQGLELLAQCQLATEFHLNKAQLLQHGPFAPAMALREVVNKLLRALAKAYVEKTLVFSSQVDAGLTLAIDEGLLLEVLGNILDNACKWANSEVKISAFSEGQQLVVCIEDNGPGFPHERLHELPLRGQRGDEQLPGQGLGLANSKEIMQHLGGSLSLSNRPQGGACVKLAFPQLS